MLRFFLDNLWRRSAGLPEKEVVVIAPLETLKETEWDSEFEQLMRNRLIMGSIRYGRMRAKGKPQYDRVQSMIKRLYTYHETGNKEILVDVANLCLMEFVECNHPKQHFHATDEHAHHLNEV